MSKKIEMIGKRFTRLVVVEEVEKNKHGHRMFRCICDCGKETIVSGNDLRRNKIKSCGCLQKDNRHQNRRVLDLVGKRFGRLVVIKEAENNKFNQRRYLCKCDCGNEVVVIATRLNQNLTRSCGCLSKDTTTERNYTHKGSKERLYMIWCAMKARCYNLNNREYENYGGRGIQVCNEWLDYSKFREFMLLHGYDSNAPRGKYTIDRIDNDGDYCPENCRVIPIQQQMYNRTDNHFITFKGKTQTITEWEREYNLTQGSLHRRLNVLHWDLERAITELLHSTKKRKVAKNKQN